MKRAILSLAMAVVMAVMLLTGCSWGGSVKTAGTHDNSIPENMGGDNSATDTLEDRRLKVVAATYPIYDWLREISGGSDKLELTLLLDSGVDLHSYEPTVQDITAIADCDMFVYVGGTSDAWVTEVLNTSVGSGSDMVAVSLLELLGDRVKQEELVEGMEHEHDSYEEAGGHGEQPDEHVWLSLKNAQIICEGLGQKLEQLEGAAGDAAAGLGQYCAKLSELDGRYEKLLSGQPRDTLVFCDRFPFRYLLDDYGLNYYAAFSGCSSETEASFETITFLASKVDELELHSVLVIETSDQSVAQTVIRSTKNRDQDILVLNSMQSVTGHDMDASMSYLPVMEENLRVLAQALS